jgi:hypothetical protein
LRQRDAHAFGDTVLSVQTHWISFAKNSTMLRALARVLRRLARCATAKTTVRRAFMQMILPEPVKQRRAAQLAQTKPYA